jgi:hypothetical protein
MWFGEQRNKAALKFLADVLEPFLRVRLTGVVDQHVQMALLAEGFLGIFQLVQVKQDDIGPFLGEAPRSAGSHPHGQAPPSVTEVLRLE